jgi:hypothetical protein
MHSPAPVETPQVIELLDRDAVAQAAYLVLKKSGDHIAGQLVDALGSPASSHNVRKRIPKVLASCGSRVAWDGLFAHLLDERFEVRTRCARALEKMLTRHPEYRPDKDAVLDVVRRELATTPKFARSGVGAQAITMDKALKDRATKSIEHIFTLLGLVLSRRPLRLAFRALQAQDGKLSGVALEYLDSILPRSLREELTIHFEGALRGPDSVVTEADFAKMIEENPSMMHRLEYWIDPANSSKKD